MNVQKESADEDIMRGMVAERNLKLRERKILNEATLALRKLLNRIQVEQLTLLNLIENKNSPGTKRLDHLLTGKDNGLSVSNQLNEIKPIVFEFLNVGHAISNETTEEDINSDETIDLSINTKKDEADDSVEELDTESETEEIDFFRY